MCRCVNSSTHSASFSPRVPYRLLTILLASAVLVAAGCGGKGPKNRITGKVTLNGQPVKGRVVFIGSDGKEKEAGIGPGGSYDLSDPPLGEVSILVKAPEKPAGAAPEEKKPIVPNFGKGDKGKTDVPGTVGTGADEGAVNPPAKYGKKDTSPLKHTVKGGSKEVHDIPLEK
jgi:hypothetical protein